MSCVNAKILSGGGCLKASVGLVGEHFKAKFGLIEERLKAKFGLIEGRLKANIGIICTPNTDVYLRVSPDVVWLTSDMLSGEFDIYSNVNWTIDVAPSEDDRDIVSMLFNELMIGNNTLFVNGEAPSQILEMLHNGQMLTNETLLVYTVLS